LVGKEVTDSRKITNFAVSPITGQWDTAAVSLVTPFLDTAAVSLVTL